MQSKNGADGLLRCSQYAFGPNRLHYCGPDANAEILGYLEEGFADEGLKTILQKFETMYPYLRQIAAANKIKNPFAGKVVEAYWLGNELLEAIDRKTVWRHLNDNLSVRKKMGSGYLNEIGKKLRGGALIHHSFHVFNVWQMKQKSDPAENLENLANCLISWGKVKKIDGPRIMVETEPLIFENGKFALGRPKLKQIQRKFESDYEIEQLRPGDIVTMHWGVPCETITEEQKKTLKRVTLANINFANRIA